MGKKRLKFNGSNGNAENGKNGNIEKTDKMLPVKQEITIEPKSENQKLLIQSIKDNIVTIVKGPAGTGKTLISVVCGLVDFIDGKYKKMIFTRPCVEANGENLGFLPGDLNEKIQPYMYPIFNFLGEYLTPQKIKGYMQADEIITLPLAYQRGITFTDSFVLLEEMQNTTVEQVRMFLTRIGENCKVVLTGDPNQSDIRGTNGLIDACERLSGVEGLGIIEFTEEDIFRSKIVKDIEERYVREKKIENQIESKKIENKIVGKKVLEQKIRI